jgi:hypothetical protein
MGGQAPLRIPVRTAVGGQRAALALGLIVGCAGAAVAASKTPIVSHQVAPKVDPAARIPVGPLGFQPPGPMAAIDRTSLITLNFLDADHLLFTFRMGGLMKRLPDCPKDDEDQDIRAVVVDVPSGKVAAQAEWRMHDFGKYLWPLADGRVLVRQRNQLFVTGASLELQPYLQTASRLREIQVAADGKVLMVEIDRERHDPEEHRRLVDEASKNGYSPPHEDVELAILRPDTKLLLAKSQARSPLHLPLIDDGFVEALPGQKDQYVLQFTPFKGDPKVFGKISSSCQPSAIVLDTDKLSFLTCPPKGGDREAVVLNLQGEILWATSWDDRFIWPNYVYPVQGGRFAVGALQLVHPILGDPDLENVAGERVQVIDAASGKLQLAVQTTPVLGAGQNFSLSADGRKFAVLRDGALEIYDLPPVSTPEPQQTAGK